MIKYTLKILENIIESKINVKDIGGFPDFDPKTRFNDIDLQVNDVLYHFSYLFYVFPFLHH